MKRIAFYDNGPGCTFDGKYGGGDIAEYEDRIAQAYINAGLAFEVKTAADEAEAGRIKTCVERNKVRRAKVPQFVGSEKTAKKAREMAKVSYVKG